MRAMGKMFLTALSFLAIVLDAAELVVADKGKSEYQIVVPDKYPAPEIEKWIDATAQLTQAAFKSNGFDLQLVQENKKVAGKPGIYIGNTDFARSNGIDVLKYEDWTYFMKVVGQDLIIAGNDRADSMNPPMCLLGTVKGVTDFLRQYVGTRFLYPSLKHHTVVRNVDGTLKTDPQGIEFLKTDKIAVPADMNVTKTPIVLVNSDYQLETFYHISLNLFPELGGARDIHSYDKAILATEYRETHPEYFALMGTKRACEIASNKPAWEKRPWLEHYCISNPEVQELIYKRMLKKLDAGSIITGLGQEDGFVACQCAECEKLYGTGKDWNEKLWIFHRKLAERLQQERPGCKVALMCYMNTAEPPKTFKSFPPSAMLSVLGDATEESYAKWKSLDVPGGLVGVLHTFGGYHQGSPYAPVRTPKYVELLVKKLYKFDVKVIFRDGPMGYCMGLEGPVYYTYGRMFDDPENNKSEELLNEFCTGAFGKAAPAMKQFYERLYKQITIYSDILGTHNVAWMQTRHHGNMSLVGFIYSPDFLLAAEQDLQQAEKFADSERVKARLSLIRIGFDYIKGLATIVHLYHAYQLQPEKEPLNRLLDAIDKWQQGIAVLYDEDKKMKPLKNWPEMYPFSAHPWGLVALKGDSYQNFWANTCINWDTKAMRNMSFSGTREIILKYAGEALVIDSETWDKMPGEALYNMKTGIPTVAGKTLLKMAYDKDNIYMRIDCNDFSESVSKLTAVGRDGALSAQAEALDISISPFVEKDKFYHFIVGPLADSKYDAVRGFITDPIHPLYGKDDAAWNGDWEYVAKLDESKKTWTAFLKIPFKTLGVQVPASGTVWAGNVGRRKFNQGEPASLIWSFTPGVKDFTYTKSFGNLKFEK